MNVKKTITNNIIEFKNGFKVFNAYSYAAMHGLKCILKKMNARNINLLWFFTVIQYLIFLSFKVII